LHRWPAACGRLGALENSYEYDPYGNQTASTGTLSNYFKFAGGFSLADRSGGDLYHFGARYYDPATGRWTQIDPLDQIGDLTEANRYLYVGGDPVNLTDPTGQNIFGDTWHAVKRGTKRLWGFTPFRRCVKAGIGGAVAGGAAGAAVAGGPGAAAGARAGAIGGCVGGAASAVLGD
jgi:RHS repeat-associated protein